MVPPWSAEIDQVSSWFQQSSEANFKGHSPLYLHLGLRLHEDPEMLRLALNDRGQPPSILLAAVHFLLLKGIAHRLRDYYSSLTSRPLPAEHAYPVFRDFCIEHGPEIRRIVDSRIVQTNEVNRCSYLLPTFCLISRRSRGRPLSLVEIGASAGLNLLWDKYSYQYDESNVQGAYASSVLVRCAVRGENRLEISREMPTVVFRRGIDLNPICIDDDDAALWVRALVWPEQRERAALLQNAIEVCRSNPPEMIRGDGLALVGESVRAAPRGSVVCVFHTHTLCQWSGEDRDRLAASLSDLAKDVDLYRVSAEWIGTKYPTLELTSWKGGKPEHDILAYCHHHGQWIEWLSP